MRILSHVFLVFFLLAPFYANAAEAEEGKTLLVKYDPSTHYPVFAAVIKQQPRLEAAVDVLRKTFIFTDNITLHFTDAFDAPSYNPNTREIRIGYGFINFIGGLYLERYPNASHDDIKNFTVNCTIFFFYDYFSHALISMYELPVTGIRSTAADNLAVILLLTSTENGYDITTDSIRFWDLLAYWKERNVKPNERDYWNERELDSQRLFNTLCLLYGSDPDKFMSKIVESTYDPATRKSLDIFAKERKANCVYSSPKTYLSWVQLLAPHLRPDYNGPLKRKESK